MDIQSEADIRTIVDAFYGDITADPVIGAYFEAVDMDEHLPKLYAFWSSVVFQTGTYRGRPFDAHLALENLQPAHFSRWLQRFRETVTDRFEGPRASRMLQRADQIATIFEIKLCDSD